MVEPKVGVIMGSKSDWETMKLTCEILEELAVPYEKKVVSAHRTPDFMFDYAEKAQGRGIKVIVAGAGGAAHLPGMVASKTLLPVIGVPIQSQALSGMDSLLSIVQMPGGVPVATVSIGKAGATNAGILAAQMLGVTDNDLMELAKEAGAQAEKCASSLVKHVTAQGYIPAVLESGNASRIIPAIEGLVFPYFTNCREALDENGRFDPYIKALKVHLSTVLVEGICLFQDGGWKLSSTSNNSWLSKIYLCQFIARKILGMQWEEQGAKADAAHVNWLLHPEKSYWCWSDQIINGVPEGSKYYPRGVTAILWLEE